MKIGLYMEKPQAPNTLKSQFSPNNFSAFTFTSQNNLRIIKIKQKEILARKIFWKKLEYVKGIGI